MSIALPSLQRLLPRGGLLPEDSWRARHRGILVFVSLHALGSRSSCW